MVFSFICCPDNSHRRAFVHGMEPANDSAEFFYFPARLRVYLRRRGGARLARNIAAGIIKKDNLSACRSCVRRYMGAVAFAALVYRRASQSIYAVLGAGNIGYIPLLLAGHDIRAIGLHTALHALSRICERVALIICAEIELDTHFRHSAYDGRRRHILAA